MKEKLRLIYFPSLLLGAAFIASYTLLYWLLFTRLNLWEPDREVMHFGLPTVLLCVISYFLLWPRIRLLKLSLNSAIFFAFLFLIAAGSVLLLQSRQNNKAVFLLEIEEPKKLLVTDLIYKGQPLSNFCLFKLLSANLMSATYGTCYWGYIDAIDIEKSIEEEVVESFDKDSFTWSYVGTLPQGDHVVYAYLWPSDAMGKFSGHFVLRRSENSLQMIDSMVGGMRHSTMIHEGTLEGAKLTYCQSMTTGTFFYEMMQLFPELVLLAQNKSREELYFGESDFFGTGNFEINISTDGKMQSREFVSFSKAEGSYCRIIFIEEGDSEPIDKASLQTLQPSSLTMGEALSVVANNYDRELTPPQLKEMMIEAIKYAKDAS